MYRVSGFHTEVLGGEGGALGLPPSPQKIEDYDAIIALTATIGLASYPGRLLCEATIGYMTQY